MKLTLSFDNGPTPGVTESVLDALAERDLLATFFVIGDKLRDPRARRLADRARDGGHLIGNHSLTHGNPFGAIDGEESVREIELARELLGELSGDDKLFRPHGHGQVGPHLLNPVALDHIVRNQYTVVLWNCFVRDSKVPTGWARRAVEDMHARDWSLLVVHDLPSGAMRELPEFLDTVLELGVEITQTFPADCVPVRRGSVLTDPSLICAGLVDSATTGAQ